LQTILDALGTLEVRALASTAGQVDIGSLRCPPNVQVHDFVDHGAVLPHADVVVTHAGLGTIAAALHRGVPLVCTPIARDQHLNASRVTTLGAGIDAGSNPRADDVAAAVSAVLADPAYRRAATAVETASNAAGGADAAVSDLERLVQGTSGG
jgi:MGT family glycosyltransferase